ncbi:NIF family HAD-type phosphatase [Lysobacter sp. D1-1-M9]|uniref:NIF family HAD-type phosphatase n=1 Tax=Novilysobacter longmucuonensis TaxID=3098603 RepID=UPI002FC6FB5F
MSNTAGARGEVALPVLALDLEGTLISNAVSQIPRPGLFQFLVACRELFPRIVMFTTVREPQFRCIADGLVQERAAPPWFAHLEYIVWTGATKDLRVISALQWPFVALVDDCQAYVHPGQEGHWVPIEQFCSPYRDSDIELSATLKRLESHLARWGTLKLSN